MAGPRGDLQQVTRRETPLNATAFQGCISLAAYRVSQKSYTAGMKTPVPRDSTPYPAPSVPFTNEKAVRQFVEKHAEEILGLTVISVDRSGGGRLFDIDVLAVNAAKIGRAHV